MTYAKKRLVSYKYTLAYSIKIPMQLLTEINDESQDQWKVFTLVDIAIHLNKSNKFQMSEAKIACVMLLA